jgi:DNA-binding Lrp family transcriptional regulator
MAKALVCINTESDNEDFIRNLKTLDGVNEAYSSIGAYDVVALIQADSILELKEIVAKNIRNMENVKSTLTLTMIESKTPS